MLVALLAPVGDQMPDRTPRGSILELLVEPVSIQISFASKLVWLLLIAGLLVGGSPVLPLRVFAGRHPFQEFEDAKMSWSGLPEDVNEYAGATFDQMARNLEFRATLGVIINLAFFVALIVLVLREKRRVSLYVAAALWFALLIYGIITRNEPLHL